MLAISSEDPTLLNRGSLEVCEDVWVEPDLPAAIEYQAHSAKGKVRHSSYRGVREDL